ncbi:MGH1-like glycoside hydrolase domain-containing protein [Anaerocolumna sedimenticola]|uniref:MGH1-like glycoside hydrolase domain-containing protein n=1 Tax=Anaerocolumna sedimenticola TaxID=2696063 RepID=UPI001FE67142|nr:hypothetical protein [Anaerocolumna sedimenticola]
MKEYQENIRKFINDTIPMVLKHPVSFIKYPFIDPGSVYDGNVWDWDTYWSVYGLLNLMDNESDPCLREKIIEHAKGNIYNFLDHQLEDGYIPMMIEVGKWKEPYLNMKHKEGVLMNMHKPFLCNQICLISDYIKDYGWIKKSISKLEKYFECYYKNYFFTNCGLFVWCDDIMIGMDNDPASFGRPKFSTANIFLNSFMVTELKAMAKILKSQGAEKCKVLEYQKKAEELVKAIQEECWDKRDQFFYSVDVDIKTRKFDWFHEGLGYSGKPFLLKYVSGPDFFPCGQDLQQKSRQRF